jgi:hypothetical protein
VKFANSVSANGRNQMHERQRRARAVTATLGEKFPQFQSLRLEFDFSDTGRFTPVPQVTVMHPAARAYFVFPCPYSDCDGEFNLNEAVATMVRAEEAHCEGRVHCNGQRLRDGKGRSPCDLTLEYVVSAQQD